MTITPRFRVLLFFALTLPGLCLVPLMNIARATQLDPSQLLQRTWLFNLDAAATLVSRVAYPLGLSIDPQQVMIGRDGWLHLGDKYQRTLTLKRRPPTPDELVRVEQVQVAAEAWDNLLKAKGVRQFRIMVGPDKSSVYPDTLPAWAQPVGQNISDALLIVRPSPVHVDLRAALRAARSQQTGLLYHPTDTHWTELGAAVAFGEFARQMAPAAGELRWPEAGRLVMVRATARSGGDLAGFLRLGDSLHDTAPTIALSDEAIETQVVDFDTGEVKRVGGNAPLEYSLRPLLVSSPSALNDRKLLWLRDSFGNAMSPMMAATFRQTVQIHWSEAFKRGELQRLVERFRPDYVFVTVVEREATSKIMTLFPTPPEIRPIAPARLTTGTTVAHVAAASQAAAAPRVGEWIALGASPSFRAAWTSDAEARRRLLALSLVCADGSTSLPLQIAWTAEGGKSVSAQLVLPTGPHAIDLWSLPGWPNVGRGVFEVVMTLDARSGCRRFAIDGPVRLDLAGPPG